MQKHTKMRGKTTMIYLALAVLGLCIFSPATQTEEEIKKKYASILGSYEFDMTSYGMEVMLVEVYVEYGSLWALPDSSDSAGEMIAVEGEEFAFKIHDPEEGTYDIKFLKDEEGVYSKCHVINELMGIDVVGIKIN